MSISLLRSTEAPDPLSDKGEHTFSYSFFIEEGSSDGLKVAIDDGYRIANMPIYLSSNAKCPFKLKELSEKTMLETVKISEKEDDIVLRLNEALGSTSAVSLESHNSKALD